MRYRLCTMKRFNASPRQLQRRWYYTGVVRFAVIKDGVLQVLYELVDRLPFFTGELIEC